MYTETDILDLTRQLNNRLMRWMIPEALLLAAVIFSFVRRIEWLSSLLFALLCAVILFSLNLSILPVSRYRAFLRNALNGRTTQSVAVFVSYGKEPVLREGVRFYPLMMRVDSAKEEMDKRQFYWDANLPKPEWQAGDRIASRSYERQIIAWEKAKDDAPLEG